MYGEISHPELKHYPPRVRRDVDVGQGGNSRRALAPIASANQQPASGAEVSTPCGSVSTHRPRGCTFSYLGCRSCTCMKGFPIRRWELIPPGSRWLYVQSTANQRSASGAGVSTPFGAVSDRGSAVFVPRLSELYMYGRISNPGMGT